MNQNRFGNITAQHLEGFLAAFDEIQKDVNESPEWFSDKKIYDALSPSSRELSWGVFYELPLIIHLLAGVQAFGVAAPFIAAAQSNDQAGELLKIVDQSNDPHFYDHLDAIDDRTKWLLLALTISAERSMRGLSLYSCSINALVQRASTGDGDDEAILTAVRLDPGVMQAPTIASRIAWATMRDEKPFLDALKGAINEPHKAREPYKKLRLAALMLEEAKGFTRSKEDVYNLLSQRLGLYDSENQREGSAMKALFVLFDKWRKESTI